jgi:hypothetical protein
MALLLSEGKLEQDEICTGQYIKQNCDRIDTKNRCIKDHQSQRVLEWAYFYPKNGCSIFSETSVLTSLHCRYPEDHSL